jgi:ferrous iron transport protein B
MICRKFIGGYKMSIKIALAGNPNSGKTTVYNALTGSTGHVGNWPGVTVEKRDGHLRGHKGALIIDLPGIYSLSPYSLEEVVARKYLIEEKPDIIINIVDASNLERNLYLTTQLLELDIPVIVSLNMIDIVENNGDIIDVEALSKRLGCPVIPTSAIQAQRHENKTVTKGHRHEHYLHGHTIHNTLISNMRGLDALAATSVSIAENATRKPFKYKYSDDIEKLISEIEQILLNEKTGKSLNKRWLAIKLFESDEKALSSVELSKKAINAINRLRNDIEKKQDEDAESIIINERYNIVAKILDGIYIKADSNKMSPSERIDKFVTNKWLALPVFFGIMWFIYWISISILGDYFIVLVENLLEHITHGVESFLVSMNASDWAVGLVIDGILGGLSSIFVFIPQLMILFFFLSLLEDCGYMSRVAFIMDRIFRKFGLSGKSFIPMLIGTGCTVPGIMASRTIEHDKDRKMTIMLTPFIPCGAKLPVFAMFAALLFSKQAWVGPSMYLIGIFSVIVSGLILKNAKLFKGDTAPFVMELPTYKIPRLRSVSVHMWEKGKSFIIKAGTIIFVAVAVIWALQNFSPGFELLTEDRIEESILAVIGKFFAPLFKPLGFGNWMATAASISGTVAKEIVVATFGVIGSSATVTFTKVSAYSFMVFTLLAAPCFAAIAATKKEMGSWKWTFIAITYQTVFAYIIAFLINNIGGLIYKGTEAVVPVVMDITLMNSKSDTTTANPATIPVIFIAFIIGGFILSLILKARKNRQL